MKKINLLLCLFMLLFVSCLDEAFVDDTSDHTSNGKVRVGLYVGTDDYQTVTSRSARDENSMYAADRMPWVFVFKGAGSSATFVEAKQAVGLGTPLLPYVTLTQQAGVVQILLLGNAPSTFSTGAATYPFTEAALLEVLAGKTLQQTTSLLQTVPYATTMSPYTGAYLPMVGSLTLTGGITASMTSIGSSGSKVQLTRIVAKVSLGNITSELTPTNWTIVGAESRSGFFQSLRSGSLIDFDANIATAGAVFYVSENQQAGETTLILKATYRGNTENYYKLNFKDPLDGSLLPLVRNKWYQFNISKVMGYGYSSFNEAFAGSPSNAISYSMAVLDQGSYDVLDNGEYYLGTSNSELLIYGNDGTALSLKAATLITNATSNQIVAASNSITVSGAGLSLVSPNAMTLATDASQPAQTVVQVTLSPTFKEGEIAIRVGKLVKIVRVVRVLQYTLDAAPLSFDLTYHDSGSAYASVTTPVDDSGTLETPVDWLSISTDGVNAVGNYSQSNPTSFVGLMMLPRENRGSSRTASFFLTRKTSERVKVAVVQGSLNYENAYILAPGSSITVPLGRANQCPLALTDAVYNAASRAYDQLDVTDTWSASLVWESSPNRVSLSSASGTGPSGSFTVTSTGGQANAVVAVKNSAGEILWSWHIWVTDYTGNTNFTANTGRNTLVFMDRNLGANSNASNNINTAGLLYQWGRKDPFPGIGQQNGTWNIGDGTDPIAVYNASGQAYAISRVAVPNVTPDNLTNAVRNPDTFYYGGYLYDWFRPRSTSTVNHNLWGGEDISLSVAARKSVFDPCPKGWRVPPWLNRTSPYAGFVTVGFVSTGGLFPGSTSAFTEFFPFSGYRRPEDGSFHGVGVNGYAWTASPIDGPYSYAFNFRAPSTIYRDFDCRRADGYPIRCCRDE